MISIYIKLPKHWLRTTIITILCLVIIYWYFTTQIDWNKLQNTQFNINWNYFWIAVILGLLSNFLDGLAWWRILKFLDPEIKAIDALMANWIGFTLGILIPFAGTVELVSKTLILQRERPELTSETVISSIAAIRTMFLVTAYISWAFLIISIGIDGFISLEFSFLLILLVWVGLTVVILFLLYLFGNLNHMSKLINKFDRFSSNHPRLSKIQVRIDEWFKNFSLTFQNILKMPRIEKIWMFILIFAQNFIKWVSTYFYFLTIANLPFWVVMVSSVVIGFVNLIPAGIPGLAGLRELFSIEVLENLGFSQAISAYVTFITSLGLWFFFFLTGVFGAIYILARRFSKKKLNAISIQSDIEKEPSFISQE